MCGKNPLILNLYIKKIRIKNFKQNCLFKIYEGKLQFYMIHRLKDGELSVYYDLNLSPRVEQIDAINFLKKSIRTGNRFMLLNLPTGVGKSYLNVMFINWYLNYINSDAKFDILTNSKILQKQYIREFDYIRNLEGKANYQCSKYAMNCEDGLELCRVKKTMCDFCPYVNAMRNFISSRISLTNFHMFNLSNIYSVSVFGRTSSVLIIDEAHDYESIFSDYYTTEININSLIKCGFSNDTLTMFRNIISEINDIEDFIKHANSTFLPELKKQTNYLMGSLNVDDSKIQLAKDTILRYTKQKRECDNKINTIELFLKEYSNSPSNWILEVNHKIDKRNKNEIRSLVIQPVWVNDYIPKIILEKYDHVIFMSGTILDRKLFCNINGLDDTMTTYHSIPSPFPIQNRPIYYIKAGKMTYKEKENTYERQLEFVKKILDKYKGKKGIIHTYNYEIATWLHRDLMHTKYGDRLLFHDSTNRDDKLKTHMNSNSDTVLVSPSMMAGIDLKDDLSRFQIIMKMPYPNIQSKKIKKRIETYSEWYNWKTVVDLMQSYGRSIRSNTDHADTFILDSSFSDIITQSDKYLPRYFTDAIKILK